MEKVCLYNFVAKYKKCAKTVMGIPFTRNVLNPFFQTTGVLPSQGKQMVEQLLLAVSPVVPFRNEADLIEEGETSTDIDNQRACPTDK